MADTPLLDQLAQQLWEERHLVTVLVYELTVARLLLASDGRHLVPDALRAVEDTVDLLRRREETGDEMVRALSRRSWIDPEDRWLEGLAVVAPPPFDHVFAEHLAAFRNLADEIGDAVRQDRALARCDLGPVTERLARLTRPRATATTDASSRTGAGSRTGATHGRSIDRVQQVAELRVPPVPYEATLHAISKAPPPSLVAFLA